MAKILYCVLILSLNWCLSSAQRCSTQSACSCSIDEYTTIDLKALQVPQGGFFLDGGIENITYFFSGCENRKFDPSVYHLIANSVLDSASLVKCITTYTTTNATIAGKNSLVTVVDQKCTCIGNAADIQFVEVTSASAKNKIKYQLSYVSKSKIQPSIQLACNTYNRTDLKIVDPTSDTLILYSPISCLQYKSHHELSTGSVFCIMFFVTMFIYFVGGALIMYLIRGARGVEVLPNYDFWCSLPGLMKDGVIYIFNGCRPFTVITAEAYDRI